MVFQRIRAAKKSSAPRSVTVKEYLKWGADDRLPYTYRELVAASGTASSCVFTKAKLIEGNGFRDEDFYKAVINRQGQRVDALLRLVADDLARLRGYALLINLNLLGNPCEVLHLPFQQWRPGIPDDNGRVDTVFRKFLPVKGKPTPKPTAHLTFDPTEPPAERAARILSWPGGPEAYPGEIHFYIHPTTDGYHPKPTYESVLVDIETEGLLKLSRRADADSGFTAQIVITEYGEETPGEEKKKQDAEKYGQFVGGDEGGRVLLNYAKDQNSKPSIDPLITPDVSERYSKTSEDLKRDIRAVFQIPDILYGEAIAGKLGTQQEFDDAISYVQNFVVNTDQRAIETGFTEVFTTFQPLGNLTAQVNPSGDYSIQNLTLRVVEIEVPSEAEKRLKALNSMSPLVATKLLDLMPTEMALEMIGITGPITTPTNAPNAG